MSRRLLLLRRTSPLEIQVPDPAAPRARPTPPRPPPTAIDGVLVIDKPRGPDLPRRRRRGAAAAAGAPRRPHRDARPDGDGRAAAGRSAGPRAWRGSCRPAAKALRGHHRRSASSTDTFDARGLGRRAAPGSSTADALRCRTTRPSARRSTRFVGTFLQVPPAYSAKKVGGVAAHRLARRGAPVDDLPAVDGDGPRTRRHRVDGEPACARPRGVERVLRPVARPRPRPGAGLRGPPGGAAAHGQRGVRPVGAPSRSTAWTRRGARPRGSSRWTRCCRGLPAVRADRERRAAGGTRQRALGAATPRRTARPGSGRSGPGPAADAGGGLLAVAEPAGAGRRRGLCIPPSF